MPIYHSVTELIGRTPLLELCNYERNHDLKAVLLAKLECMNPAGSAKDRVAANMIARAETEGRLAPGGTIIEPTSGNTGIGLAAAAAAKGYRVILTMPDTMSVERRALIAAYGAEIILTPGAAGMAGAVAKAEELHQSIPGSIIAGQFENPANPAAHEKTTGPEIWADTEGKVDIFVAGVGTGGTVSGVGRYLKAQDPAVRVVAFEPASSPLLTEGHAGPHGLQGIGANFVPENLDRSVLDEVLTVTDADAYATGRELARTEGILVGITSGAAVWAAAQLARQPENAGKTIVALLPDSGERYLSPCSRSDNMYKKPGRRPYTSPGLFRRLSGLHGVPEPVGDSTFKQAGGVAVERLQRAGGQGAGCVSGHGQIHVEDKLHLRVLGNAGGVPLHHTGARVDLGLTAGIQLQRQITGAVEKAVLRELRLLHGSGVGRREQLRPAGTLQPQPGTGEDVHIPQAHPLEIGGLVQPDKGGQRLVQLAGKLLPPGIVEGGQSDEVLGEIQLPLVVLGDEVVIGHRRLLLHLGIGAAQPGDAGRRGVLAPGILGELRADGLLKIGGLHAVDGENRREPQLADDLMGRGVAVVGPGMIGKQHVACSFAS